LDFRSLRVWGVGVEFRVYKRPVHETPPRLAFRVRVSGNE
jgi:hypothetical protein